LILTFKKLVERQCRGIALLWLAWRHRHWLRADNDGWASMGYALVTLKRFRSTISWMRDWRNRSNLKMWMLLNLALALRECRRWNEMREVLTVAIKRPERDHTFQKQRLLLAMELALVGETQEAAGHFRELNATGWSNYMQIQYRLTRGLLSVQQAVPTDRKKVFRSERAAIRKVFGQHRTSTFRSDYRRSLTRMAKDTGSRWMVFLTWVGV
jgi:hypothetical protein